jgi:hypothetical protein
MGVIVLNLFHCTTHSNSLTQKISHRILAFPQKLQLSKIAVQGTRVCFRIYRFQMVDSGEGILDGRENYIALGKLFAMVR